ncbi:hypothetical protein K438DRAFT_1765637 [Mycena galopus ATCC 62051]|nr:hypothetical protein K438DRAFT_1765637 [Mycena galopus ATCC 62051]
MLDPIMVRGNVSVNEIHLRPDELMNTTYSHKCNNDTLPSRFIHREEVFGYAWLKSTMDQPSASIRTKFDLPSFKFIAIASWGSWDTWIATRHRVPSADIWDPAAGEKSLILRVSCLDQAGHRGLRIIAEVRGSWLGRYAQSSGLCVGDHQDMAGKHSPRNV